MRLRSRIRTRTKPCCSRTLFSSIFDIPCLQESESSCSRQHCASSKSISVVTAYAIMNLGKTFGTSVESAVKMLSLPVRATKSLGSSDTIVTAKANELARLRTFWEAFGRTILFFPPTYANGFSEQIKIRKVN